MGEVVGDPVEFGVRQRGAPSRDGHGVRGAECLGGEEGWQGGVRVRGQTAAGPPVGDPGVLVGRHQAVCGHGPSGVGGHLLQEADQAGGECLGRGPVEEGGGVLDPGGEAAPARSFGPVALLREGEGEVELAQAVVDEPVLDEEAGQVRAGRLLVLEDQHGLEERVVVARPDGVEALDEPLEGHVLVGVRGEVELPHTYEEFTEGRIAGQVRPQHERVDEEADQVLQRLVRAAGDG